MEVDDGDIYRKLMASLPDPYELDEEWTLRAKKEVNEDPSKVGYNIRALKDLVEAEEGLYSRTDDTFLLAFLRARKHNIEEAFKMLKNYYLMKAKYPKYFELCLPSNNKEVYDLHFISMLENKDQHDRGVLIFSADFNGYSMTCEQVIQLITTTLEMCILDPKIQISGIVMIADVGKQNMSHKRFMSPTMLFLMAKLFQNSFPIRLKLINIINEGILFHMLYSIVLPFLKKKLRDRVHLHGKELASLHKLISPEILPEIWGGTKCPWDLDCLQQRVTPYEPLFREWTKFGYSGATSET